MRRPFLLFAVALLAVACKKPVPLDEGDGGPLARPVGATVAPDALAKDVAAMKKHFERVHFAFDSASLDSSSKAGLSANVRIMQEHPGIRIEVQGHCDERGTTDYNIALGERRAETVRKFMVAQGLDGARIATISYGEERPADNGSTEVAWGKNRRAEFRITYRESADGLVEGTTN